MTAVVVAGVGALTAATIWGEVSSRVAHGLLILDVAVGIAA